MFQLQLGENPFEARLWDTDLDQLNFVDDRSGSIKGRKLLIKSSVTVGGARYQTAGKVPAPNVALRRGWTYQPWGCTNQSFLPLHLQSVHVWHFDNIRIGHCIGTAIGSVCNSNVFGKQQGQTKHAATKMRITLNLCPETWLPFPHCSYVPRLFSLLASAQVDPPAGAMGCLRIQLDAQAQLHSVDDSVWPWIRAAFAGEPEESVSRPQMPTAHGATLYDRNDRTW